MSNHSSVHPCTCFFHINTFCLTLNRLYFCDGVSLNSFIHSIGWTDIIHSSFHTNIHSFINSLLTDWFVCSRCIVNFLFQVIEGISTLTNITSLFIGKNKITKLQGMDSLVNLKCLSLQVSLDTNLKGSTFVGNICDKIGKFK